MLKSELMPIASKAVKIFLVVVGGIVGIAVLATLLFVVFFDINRYKPRIEAALSKALAMNVAIEGPLALTVASGLQVKLERVRVSNRGAELAFVEELDLAIPLMSVSSDEMVYSTIAASALRSKALAWTKTEWSLMSSSLLSQSRASLTLTQLQ